MNTSSIPLTSQERISFHAVSCTAYGKICQDFKINGYPRIKIFLASQSEAIDDMYPKMMHPFELLHRLNVAHADEMDYGHVDQAALKKQHGSDVTDSTFRQLENYHTKKQLFADAYLSFDFILRNSFAASEVVQGKARETMKRWLELVKRSTPPTMNAKRVAENLLASLNSAMSNETMVSEILDKHAISAKEWSPVCAKGQKGMGYTCGLWALFHMVTVGVNEWNKVPANSDQIVSAKEAATTLRDFIDHFFRCDECRLNFIVSFDQCDHDRCARLTDANAPAEWETLSYWLFEVHNAVNLRLMREKSEREKTPVSDINAEQATWPLRKHCPACWDEQRPVEEMILKYIRVTYWYEIYVVICLN